jgi:hypothetical protein
MGLLRVMKTPNFPAPRDPAQHGDLDEVVPITPDTLAPIDHPRHWPGFLLQCRPVPEWI